MAATSKVVITGIGVVSPIGIGKTSFWESMVGMKSGIRPLERLASANLAFPYGGEIQDFEGKNYITPRKSLKLMSREIQQGVAAAHLAVDDAGLDCASVDSTRIGVVYGAEMIYGELDEMAELYRNCIHEGNFEFKRWGERMGADLYPLWLLKYLPNMAACHIAIGVDALGPNNTIAVGDASALLAVIEATWLIQRGGADVVITGGTGTRLNITPMRYRSDLRVTQRLNDPLHASRPFEATRDGMVNGEGAAAFILEKEEFARARGATPLAQIAGSALTFGRREGGYFAEERAIRDSIHWALERSEMTSEDIGHVNANAMGTMEDDPYEARAIRDTMSDVLVTAPKSYFGNLGAGTSAVEMAASVLALRDGTIPPTLNYDQSAQDCPVNVICNAPAQSPTDNALILSQSGSGQVAALVLSAS
jgi:3-oxoacyl-[acyl-carrier-protein] synthase II